MNADTQVAGAGDPAAYIDVAAEVFALLADPTRIRIVLALNEHGELAVNDLADLVRKNPAGVSQHLARLRMDRMVTTRQDGTRVRYRLVDEHALALVVEALKQAEHAVAGGHPPSHHHGSSS